VLYTLLSKSNNWNKSTNGRGLISYYKTNGITSFKKHVDANHSFVAQMFEEEMNNLLRRIEKR
jgi:hypothetical protein